MVARQLLINGRFLGGNSTAVNMVARALTAQLVKKSGPWSVEVVVPKFIAEGRLPSGWPIRRFGSHRSALWDQIDLPVLARDRVLAGFFNTVPLRGRGYVTLLHDTHVFDVPQSFSPSVRQWRRLLSYQAGRAGNHVFTVSEHARQALLHRNIGSSDRISVVPNGPGPVSIATPDVRVFRQLGIREDQAYCLGQASLAPHKNISLLLETFARPEMCDVRLVLFGATHLKAVEAEGFDVPSNVVFAGPVTDEALAALMGRALAVCVPSLAEGFGLPALEAMALGCPVLVAPCGALPEVVGEVGITLPPHAPDLWAGAVLHLAQNLPLRQKLGAAGRTRAEFFTWERAGEAMLEQLERWYPI